MDESQKQALLHYGTTINVPAGSKAIEQGSDSTALFLVLTGKLGVYVTDSHGTQIHLRTIDSGGHFGEISLFQVAKRTADVRAIENSTLFKLESDAFAQILKVPDLAVPLLRGLARSLAAKLADTTDHLATLWSEVFPVALE